MSTPPPMKPVKSVKALASKFGQTVKRKKKKQSEDSQSDYDTDPEFKNKRLKAVDETLKNKYSLNLSAHAGIDVTLRKSPQPNTWKNRENSPMPPPSFAMAAMSLSATSVPLSDDSCGAEVSPSPLPFVDAVQLRPTTKQKSAPDPGDKSRREVAIDLEAVRAKLRKVKSDGAQSEQPQQQQQLSLQLEPTDVEPTDIADNSTPKSVNTQQQCEPKDAYRRHHKDDDIDTEIEDVSSSRSNSLPTAETSSATTLVITLNPPASSHPLKAAETDTKTIETIETIETNTMIKLETVPQTSNKRVHVPEPTGNDSDDDADDDEDDEEKVDEIQSQNDNDHDSDGEEEEEEVDSWDEFSVQKPDDDDDNDSVMAMALQHEQEMQTTTPAAAAAAVSRQHNDADYDSWDDDDDDADARVRKTHDDDDDDVDSLKQLAHDDDEDSLLAANDRNMELAAAEFAKENQSGNNLNYHAYVLSDDDEDATESDESSGSQFGASQRSNKLSLDLDAEMDREQFQQQLHQHDYDHDEDEEEEEKFVVEYDDEVLDMMGKATDGAVKKRRAIEASNGQRAQSSVGYATQFFAVDFLKGLQAQGLAQSVDVGKLLDRRKSAAYDTDSVHMEETSNAWFDDDDNESIHTEEDYDDDDQQPLPQPLPQEQPLMPVNLSVEAPRKSIMVTYQTEMEFTPSIDDQHHGNEENIPELPMDDDEDDEKEKEKETELMVSRPASQCSLPSGLDTDSESEFDEPPVPRPSVLEVQAADAALVKMLQAEVSREKSEVYQDPFFAQLQAMEEEDEEVSYYYSDEYEDEEEQAPQPQPQTPQETDEEEQKEETKTTRIEVTKPVEEQVAVAVEEEEKDIETATATATDTETEPVAETTHDDVKQENESKAEEEEEDKEEEEEAEQLDSTLLSTFMAECGLNPERSKWGKKLHKFYSKKLKMTFAREFIEHKPSAIVAPKKFKNKVPMKVQMALSVMGKNIANTQIKHNQWKGKYEQLWLAKYSNDIAIHTTECTNMPTTWRDTGPDEMPAVLYRVEHNASSDVMQLAPTQSNKIRMSAPKCFYVDADLSPIDDFNCIIEIDELPAANALSIGVKFFDNDTCAKETECICVDDRFRVYRNGRCINAIGHLTDNRSKILIQVENRPNEPIITFSHSRYSVSKPSFSRTAVMSNFKQGPGAVARVFVSQDSWTDGAYTATLPAADMKLPETQRSQIEREEKELRKLQQTNESNKKKGAAHSANMINSSRLQTLSSGQKFRKSSRNILKTHRKQRSV